MSVNRKRLARLTDRVKQAGGVIHLSDRGGLCIHGSPWTPGDHWEPSALSDQDDADWLIALTLKAWPEGHPACPNNTLRPDDAA